MDNAQSGPVGTVSFRLLGYSPWPAERIFREVNAGLPPSHAPGDFVLIADEPGPPAATTIISSAVASPPYYYAFSENPPRWSHADNVFDAAKRAALAWRYNPHALRAMMFLDQTVGEDSLHADVQRVPYGSVMRFADGRLDVRRDGFLGGIYTMSPAATLDEATSAFESVLHETRADHAYVLLTAGFDSRLILAGLLAQGVRPIVGTIGFPHSTDRVVAANVARAFGLEHRVAEIPPSAHAKHAKEIIRLTSGSKGAAHWNLFLFCREIGLPPGAAVYTGKNGGFAKSNYFDKGGLALLADAWPVDLTRRFFRTKLTVRRRRCPWMAADWCRPYLSLEPRLSDVLTDIATDVRGFMNRLDHVLLTQRVRLFGGHDMAMLLAHAPTRCPFLDRRWIEVVARLPRRTKLGDRFHRYAIAKLAPRLLEFPFGGARRPEPTTPPFYWLRDRPEISYKSFEPWIQTAAVADLLIESRGLDEFLDRTDRQRAVAERNPLLMDFLITLHYTQEVIRDDWPAGAR